MHHRIEPPKAVIFDLDDTLISLTASRKRVWDAIVVTFASRLKDYDHNSLVAVLVETGRAYWAKTEPVNETVGRKEIVRQSFDTLGIDDRSLEDEFVDAFVERWEREIKVFPGSISTLAALRSDGIRLALLTNSTAGVETQKRKIKRFGLEVYFDHVQIEGEFGIGKPDPAAFRNVLEVLDLQAHEVWMIGDHLELDVAAAQNLGIFSIWHDHEGIGLPADHAGRPDHIVTAIPELLSLIGVDP